MSDTSLGLLVEGGPSPYVNHEPWVRQAVVQGKMSPRIPSATKSKQYEGDQNPAAGPNLHYHTFVMFLLVGASVDNGEHA